jgi:hypothetical protein
MKYFWLFLSLFLAHCAPKGATTTPNPSAIAANQLSIAGNACGPTAILNSFRFGSETWRQAATIPGSNERSQLRHIIVQEGAKTSRHIKKQRRWTIRGINAADLTDLANDLTKNYSLPKIDLTIASEETTLQKTYKHLAASLRNSLPPTAGIRRTVSSTNGGWKTVDAHFVTIISVPPTLEKNATSFPVTYIDPLGGKILSGNIRLETMTFHIAMKEKNRTNYYISADFPNSQIGKNKVKKNEATQLKIDSIIGSF